MTSWLINENNTTKGRMTSPALSEILKKSEFDVIADLLLKYFMALEMISHEINTTVTV